MVGETVERLGNSVKQHEVGSCENLVYYVVKLRHEQLDVLAIERCDQGSLESAVDFSHDVVGLTLSLAESCHCRFGCG